MNQIESDQKWLSLWYTHYQQINNLATGQEANSDQEANILNSIQINLLIEEWF